jgi:hypothetical protein
MVLENKQFSAIIALPDALSAEIRCAAAGSC